MDRLLARYMGESIGTTSALLDVIGEVWRGNPTSQNAANDPAARARQA